LDLSSHGLRLQTVVALHLISSADGHHLPALLSIVDLFNEYQMAVCQNLVPLVNIKIAGKWMFIPVKKVLIGIDPYPNLKLLAMFFS